MSIIIFFIIFILIFIFYYNIDYIFYDIEKFDTDSDYNKIFTIANNKIESFNYEFNEPYLTKYFNDIIYNVKDNIKIKENSKIFVSIASYRDSQCSYTLQNIIDTAFKPENLVIALYQQNDVSDPECFSHINTKGATIKNIKTEHINAKGPCWARFILQQLWDGEEYFLQIDSHTRFVQDWDLICIEELKLCNKYENNFKVCLTNYVSLYNLENGKCDIEPLRGPLYVVDIDKDDGFFRFNSLFVKTLNNIPQKSKGWSGCFSFSKSNIILDSPYDPYTPFLFFGEEMDIFARLFTRGWTIYAPSVPVCFTVFDRSYRKTFWEHPDQIQVSELSKLRLYYRFGLINNIVDELKKDITRYSLGKERTFKDFLKYCLE
jgi:[Skp1-protein]-hydroxyproline N-acetylglucosaminyltransferase